VTRPTEDGPVSVLIVDDQAPFRMASRSVVRRVAGFEVVGEATSGEEAVALVAALHPALVLMDINMGALNGIEAARQIVGELPDTVVFLCSTYELSDLPGDAATSGATAYINKERLSPEVLRRLWDERDMGTGLGVA
jgi:DNA-binding NarL/FixJ family response regulator